MALLAIRHARHARSVTQHLSAILRLLNVLRKKTKKSFREVGRPPRDYPLLALTEEEEEEELYLRLETRERVLTGLVTRAPVAIDMLRPQSMRAAPVDKAEEPK